MNEQAINQVITEYAIENANLRIQVATLQQVINELQEEKAVETEEEK